MGPPVCNGTATGATELRSSGCLGLGDRHRPARGAGRPTHDRSGLGAARGCFGRASPADSSAALWPRSKRLLPGATIVGHPDGIITYPVSVTVSDTDHPDHSLSEYEANTRALQAPVIF